MKITKQRLKEIIKEELIRSLKESKEVHISNIAKKIDRLEQAAQNAKKGMQNMEQGATDDADLQDIRSTNAYFAKQQEVMNLEDKIELLTKQLQQLKQDQPGQLTRGVKEGADQLDPDKYYLMDFDRVYKGPFDSYEEAEAAEDIGGLQIKSPKPKFSPEEIAAAKARAAKFGL